LKGKRGKDHIWISGNGRSAFLTFIFFFIFNDFTITVNILLLIFYVLPEMENQNAKNRSCWARDRNLKHMMV